MSKFLTRDRSVCLQPVSELAARSLDWLWPGRLALGKLAMLDGDPGMGKSLLALDRCARLSTGSPLPDGSAGPGPVLSIVVNGEDGAEDTIRPRLQALGADLERVFVLGRTVHGARDSLLFPRAGAHPGPGAGADESPARRPRPGDGVSRERGGRRQ